MEAQTETVQFTYILMRNLLGFFSICPV